MPTICGDIRSVSKTKIKLFLYSNSLFKIIDLSFRLVTLIYGMALRVCNSIRRRVTLGFAYL